MKVLFASAEAAPFFKSGGLGDVAGSLPKELKKQGVDIRVVLPNHGVMPEKYAQQLELVTEFTVDVGWRRQYCGIKQLVLDDVTYYFVDNLGYFNRDTVYGYEDDGERYAFFSLAVLEMMEKIDFIPDVLHANDWHTAAVTFLLRDKYHWIDAYADIKTVLSIHNLKYQGEFGESILSDWYGIGYNIYMDSGAKHYDAVNILKGGIYYADRVTTVSPTYAEEIKTPEFGHGLDGVLRDVDYKLSGILNGIDYAVNDPATDSTIQHNYDVDTIDQKVKNKTYLQEKVGLPVDEEVILIGMVSRLTEQKGFRLVEIIMDALTNRRVQIILLGTGEKSIENSFKHFDWAYDGQVRAIIDFDVKLAQEIYAGADLFLMPSAFEPCGLSQMISMRYGTLPLVHEIGGLKDTVAPYNKYDITGTGFSFNHFDWWVLLNTLDDAIDVYYNHHDNWQTIQKQAMQTDFSWQQSTQKYINLYQSIAY